MSVVSPDFCSSTIEYLQFVVVTPSLLTAVSHCHQHSQISLIDLFQRKYDINLLEVSESQLQHRSLFRFTKQNTAEEIMELLAEKEKMRTDF